MKTTNTNAETEYHMQILAETIEESRIAFENLLKKASAVVGRMVMDFPEAAADMTATVQQLRAVERAWYDLGERILGR